MFPYVTSGWFLDSVFKPTNAKEQGSVPVHGGEQRHSAPRDVCPFLSHRETQRLINTGPACLKGCPPPPPCPRDAKTGLVRSLCLL